MTEGFLDEDEVAAPSVMWPHICNQGYIAINVGTEDKIIAHAHFDLKTAKELHAKLGDVIDEYEEKHRPKN